MDITNLKDALNSGMFALRSNAMRLSHSFDRASDRDEPLGWQVYNVPFNELNRLREMQSLCNKYNQELPSDYLRTFNRWSDYGGMEDPDRLSIALDAPQKPERRQVEAIKNMHSIK